MFASLPGSMRSGGQNLVQQEVPILDYSSESLTRLILGGDLSDLARDVTEVELADEASKRSIF